MKFLPENYQAPKSSNFYMKLQDGENRIRILSQPILGWEDWIENKPVRFRFEERPAKSHDPKKPVRHFWAFIVWNYLEEKIQILQITQATIRSNLEALCKDKDWGEPYFYDIKIFRKGEGVDTEYMVNPVSHKPINPKIIEAFRETPINLDALFDGEDPFSGMYSSFTTGVFEQKEGNEKSSFISKEQCNQLKEIFVDCDQKYVKQVMEQLKKANPSVDAIEKIPTELYERIRNAAVKKRQEYLKARMEGDELDLEESHG